MATIQPVPDINPALPAFPGPNIPESQYDDQAYEWGTAIPGYGQRVKAVADNAFNNAQAAAGILGLVNDAQRLTELARDTAMGVANFKGDWNTLSGSLARPATVQHNSSVWLLMRDVANVANEQPGISTAWVNQTARVASVMGRSGDVVGLTENTSPSLGVAAMSTAPLGQWVSFNSTGVAGGDWPTTLGTAWWNVFTYGSLSRRFQRATQILNGAQQGWAFERQMHDATWSSWRRIFNDSSLIERVALPPINSGVVTCDPAAGSMYILGLTGSMTLNILPPRDVGDQLTIRIFQTSNHALSFSSNVVLPIGVSLPATSAGELLTFTMITDNNKTKWFLFVCGKHAA